MYLEWSKKVYRKQPKTSSERTSFREIRLHLEITGDGDKVELIRARFTNEVFDTLVNLRLDLEEAE